MNILIKLTCLIGWLWSILGSVSATISENKATGCVTTGECKCPTMFKEVPCSKGMYSM
jgi:hypothetical protein